MRIISIANFKGGTGKTVTACNLAALAAREGKRVLLIDADAQHNSSDFFGADPEGCTLTDVLEGTGEPTAADNVQETTLDNLDVLPADMGLLRLDLAAILNQSNAPLRRMDDFLDCLREDGDYDVVVIDCPPSFTAASVAALVNSDEVLMPTRADAFSRRGVLEIQEQLRSVGLKLLRPMPRIRVLITMADARSSVPRQVAALYRSEGFEVCGTAIRSGVAVSKSTWQRLPLYAVAPLSNPAQDYEALARELLGERIATPACALARNDGEGRAEMAKKFNLSEYIQQAESKMDTMPKLTAVELHLIDPSPANFYSMEGLESLADNIATVGLLEPLRVREKDGRYVVVSGHRRRAALRILMDRGEMDPHDKIPVFLDADPDPGEAQDKDAARIALRQLRLIYANSDNRQYSSADKTREVQELTSIFSELKRLGYQFPGKIREYVAAAAHISDSRAARLAVIGKKLTAPKLREAYEAGRLGENAAYEIARRDAAVISRVDELPMGTVCSMTIDRLGAVLESLEKQVQEDQAAAKAYNDGVKAMQPETPVRSSFDAEAYLAERAEEDDAFFEMLSEEADPFLKHLGAVNSRQDGIQRLKEELGRDHSGWLYDWVDVNCSPKGVRLWDVNRKRGGEDITRTWTDVYDMLCTIALNRAAVNIGAEIGDEETDPSAALGMTNPEWQTGEPTRPGRYFCRVRLGNAGANEQRGYWDDGWTFYGMRLQEGWEVLSWWPLPKEG